MDNVLCKVCGKFVSKANYARHHKSHFEEVKFACYQCAKSFKRKDKLEDHLRTHRKPEEIRCSQCSHVVHSSSALKKHIKTRHENISYSCEYCNKSFTQESYCKKDTSTCKFWTVWKHDLNLSLISPRGISSFSKNLRTSIMLKNDLNTCLILNKCRT